LKKVHYFLFLYNEKELCYLGTALFPLKYYCSIPMCFITIFSTAVTPFASSTKSSARTSLIASRSSVLPFVTQIAYFSSTGASSASVAPA
jgi:hypothetical protein